MSLISVIVPIYNVEKYLHRCVDSILKQTYGDLEIILVDDGSTDNCGKICDEYAKKDRRIKVIHKENGGQSSARNVGLDYATGEYVSFIDSDDFIHPQMLEMLYKAVTDFDVEMACCDFFRIKHKKDFDNIIYKSSELAYEILSRDEIFANYHDRYLKKLQESVCNKLIRREMFDGLKFCERMIYEDEHILMYIVNKIKRCAIINAKLYYYNEMNSSTMRSGFSEKKFSGLDLARDEVDFFYDNKSEREKFLLQYAYEFITISIIVHNGKNEYLKIFKKYRREFLRYLPKVLLCKNICNMLKLVTILSVFRGHYCKALCEKYFKDIFDNISWLCNDWCI